MSPFVAILADETTDISCKAQFSLVYRYILNGNVIERFICFNDVSGDKSASAIASLILKHIKNFATCGAKLVAQTYDGAAVMSSAFNGVQSKIKDVYPQTLFVHRYAHVLNLVLSQSVQRISTCKIFFASLNGLAAFFTQSTKRTKVLDEFLPRRLPHVCPTHRNYASRLVNTVHEKLDDLRLVFDLLLDNAIDIPCAELTPISGHLANLEDFNFCFCLAVFHKIYSLTDVLFSYLQKYSFDILSSWMKIDITLQKTQESRNDFDAFYEATERDVGAPRPRRRNTASTGDARTNFRVLLNEIIDTITQHMQTRFSDFVKIRFLDLLDSSKYSEYQKTFPEESFRCLLDTYGFAFDEILLKNQLIFLYLLTEFHGKSPTEMLQFFSNNTLLQKLLYRKFICFAV